MDPFYNYSFTGRPGAGCFEISGSVGTG